MRTEVAELVKCTYKTLSTWIDKFLEGGLNELVQPITHQVLSRLNPEQRQELKIMLLEQKPIDYGIDRNIWTGKIISSVIESRWGVKLQTSRIYEILSQLNLSHQKGHRDYENADKEQQKNFISTLKKTSKLSRQRKKSYFLMNLPSTTVQVCFMDGLKKTLVLRSPAMKKSAEIN